MRVPRAERMPRRESRPTRWHEPLRDRIVRAYEEEGETVIAQCLDAGSVRDVATLLLDRIYPTPMQDTANDYSGPEWMQDIRPTWPGKGGG